MLNFVLVYFLFNVFIIFLIICFKKFLDLYTYKGNAGRDSLKIGSKDLFCF